jgi:hypothetical protein
MAQDPVDRIVFISAYCLMNVAYSNGFQIQKRISKPVTDSFCLLPT